MSRLRLAFTLVGVCSLALGLIGPASAGTHAQSKYGGTLVVGIAGSDFDSLDPTVSRSNYVADGGLCLRLYEPESNHGKLELTPVLASAPPTISSDGLSYAIHVRQGILFNDGTPFTAQSVVTTYQRFVSYPGSLRADLFVGVDRVTTAGPYTVVFHLKVRDSTFTGNIPVLSPTALATEGAGFAANPVCIAPYMFDHWVPGDNLTLVKSPYYYKRAAIHIDKVVLKPMSDAAAAVAALQAGSIQVLYGVSTTALPALQQNPAFRIIQTPDLGWQAIVVNIGNSNGVGNLPYRNIGTPLASSPELRQAFEEAIDRNDMVKVVFGGLAQPSCTAIPQSNTGWYAATKIPCTSYDPADAKKLVAKSGFTNPTVHLLVSNTTDRLRLAQFIQAEEAAVGINVVIDATDGTTQSARVLTGSFDAATRGFPGDFDPNGQIYRFLATSGDRDYSGYSNPRMDYVLANALKATKMTARATGYRVAQQIAQADRPLIYLYNSPFLTAVSASVSGVQFNAIGVPLLANAQYK